MEATCTGLGIYGTSWFGWMLAALVEIVYTLRGLMAACPQCSLYLGWAGILFHGACDRPLSLCVDFNFIFVVVFVFHGMPMASHVLEDGRS